MPPKTEPVPSGSEAVGSGLSASRWAAPAAAGPSTPRLFAPRPSAPRPFAPRPSALRPSAFIEESGSGLGASCSVAPSDSGVNPFPTDTGSINSDSEKSCSDSPKPEPNEPNIADPSDAAPEGPLRDSETEHHIKEDDSKITIRLHEIDCLIRGIIKDLDSAPQGDIAFPATANLSILIDKAVALGKNQEFVAPAKGSLSKDRPIVRLNIEGDGRLGKGPALGVNIGDTANEEPAKSLEVKSGQKPDLFFDLRSEGDKQISAVDTPHSDNSPSRSIIIWDLPRRLSVEEILDLITPTKNTHVIEIKLVLGDAITLSFATPAGAKDFLSQWESGSIVFPYSDEQLGTVEWKCRVQILGNFVPVKPETLPDYLGRGATRYLRIRGRSPIAIREAHLTWSLDKYCSHLGIHNHVYTGQVYRDEQDFEIVELGFLSVSRAISLLHVLKDKDGFLRSSVAFLADRHFIP
ncbi:hypothetical protein TWF730_006830 [Orbilia blumenaviensis]|uniref:Uncharacterized protein n=1 Tax=Orbilia blumenaviensis TaxID=1796055 RepID=A0AAV9VHS4_9PEZI